MTAMLCCLYCHLLIETKVVDPLLLSLPFGENFGKTGRKPGSVSAPPPSHLISSAALRECRKTLVPKLISIIANKWDYLSPLTDSCTTKGWGGARGGGVEYEIFRLGSG